MEKIEQLYNPYKVNSFDKTLPEKEFWKKKLSMVDKFHMPGYLMNIYNVLSPICDNLTIQIDITRSRLISIRGTTHEIIVIANHYIPPMTTFELTIRPWYSINGMDQNSRLEMKGLKLVSSAVSFILDLERPIIKIVRKLLWIAIYKENSLNCPLANLPREIVPTILDYAFRS